MLGTTSSEFEQLEEQMRDAVETAEEYTASGDTLAIAIHPEVEQFIQEETGLASLDDPELKGIHGVTRIVETYAVPGFRVVICDGNL